MISLASRVQPSLSLDDIESGCPFSMTSSDGLTTKMKNNNAPGAFGDGLVSRSRIFSIDGPIARRGPVSEAVQKPHYSSMSAFGVAKKTAPDITFGRTSTNSQMASKGDDTAGIFSLPQIRKACCPQDSAQSAQRPIVGGNRFSSAKSSNTSILSDPFFGRPEGGTLQNQYSFFKGGDTLQIDRDLNEFLSNTEDRTSRMTKTSGPAASTKTKHAISRTASSFSSSLSAASMVDSPPYKHQRAVGNGSLGNMTGLCRQGYLGAPGETIVGTGPVQKAPNTKHCVKSFEQSIHLMDALILPPPEYLKNMPPPATIPLPPPALPKLDASGDHPQHQQQQQIRQIKNAFIQDRAVGSIGGTLHGTWVRFAHEFHSSIFQSDFFGAIAFTWPNNMGN